MTINIQSWATPVVGVVMLIVGLFGGYYGRSASDGISEQAAVPSADAGAKDEELMAYLVSQTRHFKGDPNAPVTLIEFGDFQ